MPDITLADAYDEARRNNIHKKQLGFALVVVYEREGDRPFVKVGARCEEGDAKLSSVLKSLADQLSQ